MNPKLVIDDDFVIDLNNYSVVCKPKFEQKRLVNKSQINGHNSVHHRYVNGKGILSVDLFVYGSDSLIEGLAGVDELDFYLKSTDSVYRTMIVKDVYPFAAAKSYLRQQNTLIKLESLDPCDPLQVATPIADLVGGEYTLPINVTLKCFTPTASIYYTTDGSTPTTSSNLYSSSITVNTDRTRIRAIAVKAKCKDSSEYDETYYERGMYFWPNS